MKTGTAVDISNEDGGANLHDEIKILGRLMAYTMLLAAAILVGGVALVAEGNGYQWFGYFMLPLTIPLTNLSSAFGIALNEKDRALRERTKRTPS